MKTYNNALIIDDDQDLCFLLKNVLKSKVNSVHIAGTLQEGKELLTKSNPEVIFLDNNLPDGQGVMFISLFKHIAPQAKIIVISAIPTAREKAIDFGADAFMENPMMAEAINNLLAA